MRFEVTLSQPFNLDCTLNSGQTFTWQKIGCFWYGTLGSAAVRVAKIQNRLQVESDSVLNEETILRYFGLEDDLLEIYNSINKDSHINRALEKSKGLRIIRQDPWEVIFSFIAATNISIKRVEGSLNKLCEKSGSRKVFNGVVMYTFPTPQAILEGEVNALKDAGFGYRASWLVEAAKVVADHPNLMYSLLEQSYESARSQLLRKKTFIGVGEKAADCILLFGFNKLESFPIDRWIRQNIVNNYAHLFDADLITKLKAKRSLHSSIYNKIRRRMIEYFGKYAGYAQQYLFVYERLVRRSQPQVTL